MAARSPTMARNIPCQDPNTHCKLTQSTSSLRTNMRYPTLVTELSKTVWYLNARTSLSSPPIKSRALVSLASHLLPASQYLLLRLAFHWNHLSSSFVGEEGKLTVRYRLLARPMINSTF